MKHLILLSLLVLVSCGEDSVDEQPVGNTCEVRSEIMNRTWDQNSTGNRYDASGCSVGVTCRLCLNVFCDDDADIDITYYDNGTITLDYFNVSTELSARWKICNEDELILYNFSNGSESESFQAIN